MIDVRHGDCREVIKTLADDSIHAVVTDPPYSLVSIQKRFGNAKSAAELYAAKSPSGYMSRGFMGKQWDNGETAFDPAFWAEVYRVLKPGAHLIAFGGTRTYHRLACAIEDAGFEIRDQIGWLYGSGFPKSHDVSKAIDRAAGAEREVVGKDANFGRSRIADGKTTFGDYAGEWDKTAPATDLARQWEGWGTALKPAWEPIVLARKPLIGTVAANVLAHGTGAINVDGCRVGVDGGTTRSHQADYADSGWRTGHEIEDIGKGRWPANIIHDGSEEVIAAFPETGDSTASMRGNHGCSPFSGLDGSGPKADSNSYRGHTDNGGSAARFFYTAKADSDDRLGSKHPTVKPVDLMAYLVRLVTPPGGTVLDPFAGSGTTGMACMREGFDCILIEREAEYVADIKGRLTHVEGADLPLFTGMIADEPELPLGDGRTTIGPIGMRLTRAERAAMQDPPLTRAELDADARGNYELALEELRRR